MEIFCVYMTEEFSPRSTEESMSDVVRRLREFQAAAGIEGGILEDPDEWLEDVLLDDGV